MASARPIVKKRLLIGVLAVLGIAVASTLIWSRHHSRSLRSAAAAHTMAARMAGQTYVGSSVCATCHVDESAGWKRSQHAAAMAEASEPTVLGRFDGARFSYAGTTSTFFRREGKFYARTDGADGRLADFEITHTFGVAPLQQYLVTLPDGRLQALGVAWDTRPVAAGGQRWFHLYPKEAITAGDPLHWTGLQQNWNFMCADCHTTNLRKGYDPATREFRTSWSEIGVGCESCHGPGSAHVTWAHDQGRTPMDATRNLTAPQSDRQHGTWTISTATGLPSRSEPRRSDQEIDVCARCHARRSQLTDDAKAGDPLENTFRPSLLEAGLFYADGQQRDEVYTYASFLQSKMYASGVTCSDCHDPHTGGVRRPGNALCAQCHTAAKYDTPTHHFHQPNTAASACVTCHMPASTYMQIDARHDHSLRIPRPDRTVSLGVPNACTAACHREKPAAWAAAELQQRFRHVSSGFQKFAEAFVDADRGAPGAAAGLTRVMQDGSAPAITRASAAARMAAADAPLDPAVAAVALHDPSPMVRRATIEALQPSDPSTRLRLVAPLLEDPIRTVRSQAALSLADVPAAQLPASFQPAFDEYVAEQRRNADRPEAQTNLGIALLARGRADAALEAFREALRLDRTFVAASINLADLYRERNDEGQAERALRDALVVNPRAAALHHALGLALVRQHRTPEALVELAAAVRLSPDVARYAYVDAVALHDSGRAGEAMALLTKALSARPFDRDMLQALAAYRAEAGR